MKDEKNGKGVLSDPDREVCSNTFSREDNNQYGLF